MIRVGVLVSGGGTNLQAIIDAVKNKTITNASLEVVISNKKDAYALTRAKENNIAAECVCVKDYETREEFNKALIEKIDSYNYKCTSITYTIFLWKWLLWITCT